MSANETIRIAHTARCKLHMAANRPDRDFRFILGHALTLDKLMLRVAEIEIDSSSDGDEDGIANEEPTGPRERRISFSGASKARHDLSQDRKRQRSPPPAQLPHPGDSSSDEEEEDDDAEEDDEDDSALSLQRFPSATAQPPRMVEDEGYDDGEGDVSKEPLELPSEDDLKTITQQPGDPTLTGAYQNLAGCPCHKQKAPMASNVWEVPQKGVGGGRLAVVQVQEVMA